MTKERILVVDDELDNRVMMRYFLESWGYEVELASNGKEALEKVAGNRPALVLLDLEMPIMNGFETCDRLKSDPDTEHIPVIMFTGLEQTTDKVKGIKKGADDYVVKTVDPEELQARIEMILRRAQRYATQEGSGAPEEEHAVSGSLADLQFAEAMQLILTYGKTGVMHLIDGSSTARVYVMEGQQVVHAEVEDLRGEEAFYKLAFWKAGKFRFQVGEEPENRTITASGTNLLIEATRRLDEWNMFSSKIPSFDVTASIRLTRKDWGILRLADGQRSITQIAESLSIDSFEAGRLVFGLLTVGAISLEPEPEQREDLFEAVPELMPELPSDEPLHLTALQWKVLASIDGKRSMSAMANRAGVPTATVVEMVKDMAGLGWVNLDQSTTEAPAIQLSIDRNEQKDATNVGVMISDPASEQSASIKGVLLMQGFFVFPNRSGERAVWSTAHQEQEEVPMTWVKLLRVTKVLVLAGAMSFAVTLTASTEGGRSEEQAKKANLATQIPSSSELTATDARTDDNYVVVLNAEDNTPLKVYQKYLEKADFWRELTEYNLLAEGVQVRVPAHMLKSRQIPAKVNKFSGRVEIARHFD